MKSEDMYVQYVKKESTRTADRKAYKYLMSYLKKITKYPDGKKIARDIAIVGSKITKEDG